VRREREREISSDAFTRSHERRALRREREYSKKAPARVGREEEEEER